MEAATPVCIAAIKACQTVQASCLVAIETCNAGLLIPYTLTGMNPYGDQQPSRKRWSRIASRAAATHRAT